MERRIGQIVGEPWLKGTGNPEVRKMIESPAEYYVPPTEEQWQTIEPDRKIREAMIKNFKMLVEEHIVSSALGAHEQKMEEKMIDELGIPKNVWESVRNDLLEDRDVDMIEKTYGLSPGTIDK